MQRTNIELNQNYAKGTSPNQYTYNLLLVKHKPVSTNADTLHGQLIRYIDKLNKSYFKQKKRHVSTVRININNIDDADMMISPIYLHILNMIKETIPNCQYLIDSIIDDFQVYDWINMGFRPEHIYNAEIAQDYNDLTDAVVDFILNTQDKPLDAKYKDSNKKYITNTIVKKPIWAKQCS